MSSAKTADTPPAAGAGGAVAGGGGGPGGGGGGGGAPPAAGADVAEAWYSLTGLPCRSGMSLDAHKIECIEDIRSRSRLSQSCDVP